MRRRLVLAALLAVAAPLAVAALALGCSDDAPTTSRASADAAVEASRPAPPPDTSDDGGSCAEACNAEHPHGAPENAAIDRCWAASCPSRCVDFTDLDAGDDAGPAACGSVAVATPSAACDECTVARCCDAWAACFSDPDCVALNACLQRCPTANE